MNVPENEPKEPRSVTLLLHCPLRLGLAAGLTQFIYTHGGRILYHEQYVDTDGSITKENKSEVEDEQMALLQSHRIDVVVLARYMQILTGRFVEAYLSRMINIHHAFLPAFPGARPYYSARQYLHVSGEDDDVDPMALKEGHLLVFDLALVLLRDGAVSVDVLLVVEDAPSVGVDELGQTGGQAETEGAMQQQGDRPGLLWFVLGNVHSPSVPCAGLPELTHLE